MTPTPHGQVPEALIDLIDAYAETRHRCGGIYNARTEAARKAVIEALSGVQALSAGPMVTSEQRRLIGVIADKIEDGTLFQSGIYPKKDLARFVRNMLDTTPTAPAASPTPPALSAAPAIGDELRDTLVAVSAAIAERDDRAAQKMICEILAASTTPPAEQQAVSSAVLKAIREANMQLVRTGDDAFMLVPYKVATTEAASPKAGVTTGAALGGVYAELPAPLLIQYDEIDCEEFGCFAEGQMRDFADRTHALRMEQAAPKAAPTRTALPEGWTDCTIEFGNDGPEVVAYGPKRMMNRLAKWLGKYFAQVIADAAPKAAPGEQNTVPAEWLEQAYREGWAACRDAETIGEEAEDWAFGNSTANSRMIDAQQAAPKQEAQEPCPTCVALARTVMLDQVSFDRKPDCYGIRQITDDEGVEEWEDIRTSPDVAREEANDMMATGRGEIYEVVPLWTTPQLAPQSAPVCHHRPPVR